MGGCCVFPPTAAATVPTATISARIPHEDIAELRKIAERNHSTVSRLVAAAVRRSLPALDGRADVEPAERVAA